MGPTLTKVLVEAKIRRLSLNQLKALLLLCQQERGLVSSTKLGQKLGIQGKSLGGVFSSLSRQRLAGRPLIIPFGREPGARGLCWRVNPEVISAQELAQLVESILKFWSK